MNTTILYPNAKMIYNDYHQFQDSLGQGVGKEWKLSVEGQDHAMGERV
jgi:hypothetical protein